MKNIITVLTALLVSVILYSCGGGEPEKTEYVPPAPKKEAAPADNFMDNKGIGPIKEVVLSPEIDTKMADAGKKVYLEKCKSCHKENEKYIGPPPAGILDRRSPEWIMNMILNPEVMVKEDPIAKKLFKEYLSPMANQNLTEPEARSILEYFRTLKEDK